jgi:TonB family protein
MARTSRKLWVVVGSIVAHLGIGVGVFAAGVWDVERLDGNFQRMSPVAALMPMPEAGGGEVKLREVKIEQKERTIVKEPVQPTEIKPTDDKPAVTTTSIGNGSGEGSGSGSGSAGDKGKCLVDCGGGSDGSGSGQAKKDPPPDDTETMVPPSVLQALRIGGDPNVYPSEVTKNSMLRDGKNRVVGVLKVCVTETGSVKSVDVIASTKYPAYDRALVDRVRTWPYKPYAAKGRNLRVCGTVTFVYSIK